MEIPGTGVGQVGDHSTAQSDGPPSRKAFLLLQWLIQKDSEPKPFFIKINGELYPGQFKRFDEETVVDSTSQAEYASLMRWAIHLKSQADGRECPGMSIKPHLFYNGTSIKDHESIWFDKKQPASSQPSRRQVSQQPSPDEVRTNTEHRAAKLAKRSQESAQRREVQTVQHKKKSRLLEAGAKAINAELDKYSRSRGFRGTNTENYAACAQLLSLGVGLPASAVQRCISRFQTSLDDDLHRGNAAYPDSSTYCVEGDHQTCYTLSERFHVCPIELTRVTKRKFPTVKMSTALQRHSTLDLPSPDGNRYYYCKGFPPYWCGWVSIDERLRHPTADDVRTTIVAPSGQQLQSWQALPSWKSESEAQMEDETLLVIKLQLRRGTFQVLRTPGSAWWRCDGAGCDGGFVSLLAAAEHCRNCPLRSGGGSAASAQSQWSWVLRSCVHTDLEVEMLKTYNTARAFLETAIVKTDSRNDVVPTILNNSRGALYNVFASFFPHCIHVGTGLNVREFNEIAYDVFEMVFGPDNWVSEGLAGCCLLDIDPASADFSDSHFRNVMVDGLGLPQDGCENLARSLRATSKDWATQRMPKKIIIKKRPASAPAQPNGTARQSPGSDGHAELVSGQRVVFHSLVKWAEYNGRIGIIDRWDPPSKFYRVRTDDGLVVGVPAKFLTVNRADLHVGPGRSQPEPAPIEPAESNVAGPSNADAPVAAHDESNGVSGGLADAAAAGSSGVKQKQKGGAFTAAQANQLGEQTAGDEESDGDGELSQKRKRPDGEQAVDAAGAEPVAKLARLDPMERRQFAVGTPISKEFGGVLFVGWIVKRTWDEEDKCDVYHVQYEDQDEEDLEVKEVRELAWPPELDRDLSEIEVGHMVAYWKPSETARGHRCRFDVGRVVSKSDGEVVVKPMAPKKGVRARFGEGMRPAQRLELVRRMEPAGIICFGFELTSQGQIPDDLATKLTAVGLLQ